jgi:hypothetical protein
MAGKQQKVNENHPPSGNPAASFNISTKEG